MPLTTVSVERPLGPCISVIGRAKVTSTGDYETLGIATYVAKTFFTSSRVLYVPAELEFCSLNLRFQLLLILILHNIVRYLDRPLPLPSESCPILVKTHVRYDVLTAVVMKSSVSCCAVR
jgi:hypothetical protein